MLKKLTLCIVALTSLAWAQPAGTFWVGESEGDDFNYKLRVHGATGSTLERVEIDGSIGSSEPVQIQPLGENFYLVKGGELHGYLKYRNENEALMWMTGETRLHWLLRSDPEARLPISGEWRALAGNELFTVEVEAEKLVLKRDSGEVAEIALSPVVKEHGEFRMVAHPSNAESYLLYFVEVQPDLWLVRNHEEDTSLFLFRGEAWQERMLQEHQKRAESTESQAAPTDESAEP